MLTETFGVCGIGWRYDITKQWTEIKVQTEKWQRLLILICVLRLTEHGAKPFRGLVAVCLLQKKNQDCTNKKRQMECYKDGA